MNLFNGSTAFLEVFQPFLDEFESISSKGSNAVLVKLKDFEILHSSYQSHQIVVVGLKILLVQYSESQGLNMRSHCVNVVIEQFEVLVLWEIE